MSSSDSPYLDPYRDAVAEMGAGFEAQLWLSKDAQATRFRVIAGALGPKPGVIADLGCGQGDLLMFLKQHKQLPKHFIGVEGVDEMTHHAQQLADKANIKHAVFQTHDFVADDWLPKQLVEDANVETFIFSGSLNTLSMDQAQSVLAKYFSALKSAGRGRMVFNFLSNRHNVERTPAQAPAVRFDPVEMFDWAIGLTKLTQLRHEYLAGHDATIVMDVVNT
ncbi:MAG: class I SAM-dependent methyltransferase [Phycisphaerales bacterium]|nr:class I SAM-dependent methyltransferase [Phycisphaerales bacterium]